MVRLIGMFLVSAFAVGCVAVPVASVTPVSSAAATPEAPSSIASLPAATVAAPEPGACTAPPVDAEDPRCPEAILQSAAMSFLGKTAAEFDGVTMHAVEYDAEELMTEARANPGFRRLLQDADARPADGRLDRAEAQVVELAVYAAIEDRLTSSR